MAESLWFSFRPKLPTWGAEGAAADVAWDAESAAPAPSVKAGIGSSLWRMDKMGRWVDPLAYVVNGSSNLHAVWHGVRHLAPRSAHADSAEWDFDLETLDAPLVSPGALMPTGAFNMRRNYSFPGVGGTPYLVGADSGVPRPQDGWHFNLFNNAWNTNCTFRSPSSSSNLRDPHLPFHAHLLGSCASPRAIGRCPVEPRRHLALPMERGAACG